MPCPHLAWIRLECITCWWYLIELFPKGSLWGYSLDEYCPKDEDRCSFLLPKGHVSRGQWSTSQHSDLEAFWIVSHEMVVQMTVCIWFALHDAAQEIYLELCWLEPLPYIGRLISAWWSHSSFIATGHHYPLSWGHLVPLHERNLFLWVLFCSPEVARLSKSSSSTG